MTTNQLTGTIAADATHTADASTKASRRKTAATTTLAAVPSKPKRDTTDAPRAKDTKAELVLKKLRLARGATVEQLIETTGWQAHSVRGFLSAVVRKKLSLNLTSEVAKDGQRRYRIVDASEAAIGNAG